MRSVLYQQKRGSSEHSAHMVFGGSFGGRGGQPRDCESSLIASTMNFMESSFPRLREPSCRGGTSVVHPGSSGDPIEIPDLGSTPFSKIYTGDHFGSPLPLVGQLGRENLRERLQGSMIWALLDSVWAPPPEKAFPGTACREPGGIQSQAPSISRRALASTPSCPQRSTAEALPIACLGAMGLAAAPANR